MNSLLLVLAASAGPVEDRELIGQLDREVIALRQKVERLQSQLATCSTESAPDPIYSELRQVLQGHPAVVERRGRDTLVVISLDTLFAPDAVSLRQEAEPLLDLLSTGLKLHPDLTITAIAHVDSGSISPVLAKRYPTAWELSAGRAALVVREMVEGFGVSPHRFTAGARGDQEPVASNDTPEGRLLNRRIVFLLESAAVDDAAVPPVVPGDPK